MEFLSGIRFCGDAPLKISFLVWKSRIVAKQVDEEECLRKNIRRRS